MLIVANGAYKSGSTWLYQVARGIVRPTPIPPAFQNPRWMHQSIDPDKLAPFLAQVDFSSRAMVVKNHLRTVEHRDLLLAHPDVRVLDIRRDIRDVVVSAYYHEGAHTNEPFADFYWRKGRTVARRVEGYHALWAGHPSVYCASYEGFLSDFDAETRALGGYLGVTLGQAAVDRVRELTSFKRLQEKSQNTDRPAPFHRKGIAGDWRNHFDDASLADLTSLVARAKAS